MNLYDTIVLPLIEWQRTIQLATGYRPKARIELDGALFMALLEERLPMAPSAPSPKRCSSTMSSSVAAERLTVPALAA